MIYLTAILSLLSSVSCLVDAALLLKKSRFYAEMGWGLPSPLSFSCIALACILLSLYTADAKRRPAGKTMRILLVLGALLLLADQVVALGDMLAPILWTAFGSTLGVLLLGMGLLCGGMGLLRGGVRTTPGKALTMARGALVLGGGGTLLFNLMVIFRMDLSYEVTTYALPSLTLLMTLGIVAMVLSMKNNNH